MAAITWSAADIKRGLRVQHSKAHVVATVYQSSWKSNDNIDSFILVAGSAYYIFMPEVMNAAQMAIYLTMNKFKRDTGID